MQRKRLLITIGAVLVALLIVSAAISIVTFRFLNLFSGYRPPPTPPELRQARIVTGEGFLARTQFLRTRQSLLATIEQSDIGTIEDIAVGEFDPLPGLDVVVAGRYGAVIVDRHGSRQSVVGYDFEMEEHKLGPFTSDGARRMLGDIQIVDIEGDGVSEYLGTGSIDGVAVFDHQGKRLWSIASPDDYDASVRNVTIGDLNGDGIAEFVGSRNGIEAFDRSGKTIWRQQLQFSPSHLAVVDVDGDGKNEIVTGDGNLTIRDANGKELRSVELPVYPSSFSLCRRPDQKVPNLIEVEHGYLWLIDFTGGTVAKFPAPLSTFDDPHQEPLVGTITTSAYRAKGVWLKLQPDQPEYLAVVTQFAGLKRSVLYVYSGTGALVYQEILPEQSTSIAVLPSEKSGEAGRLLVGGAETLWSYSAK